MRRFLLPLLLLGAPGVVPLAAQPAAAPATRDALLRWLALDAPTGDETRATDAIRATDPRWTRDALGNLVLRVGRGEPRRLVACGLDHTGLVVSQLTDDGYLRLHRAGGAPLHPLWEQFHEGQQVAVRTARGDVPGVIGIANGHFARQHRGDTTVVGPDQLWLDVGARSRAEAQALGVALLDPVRRDHAPWPYADLVSGADASGRAGCAAVASVAAASARTGPTSGETVFAITVQRAAAWSGLQALVARLGPFDAVVTAGPADTATAAGAVTRRGQALAVRARHVGTLVESVRLADAEALRAAVREAAGLPDGAATPWVLPATAPNGMPNGTPNGMPNGTPNGAAGDRALAATAALLDSLVALPGVPGDERRVRDAVRAALPAWARARATVDSAGNLVVAAGPERDTTLFVAHLDEIAWTVSAIAPDGTVSLAARGGVIPSAWEGQPALLHLRDASLPGVFVPRAPREVRGRRPEAVRAWFGLDSAALVARGVRVGTNGSGVTATKRGARLGATRYTARSLDDRAGTAALLLAARALDPARLTRRVVLAWSTREETGLEGARAMAAAWGAGVRRAYAIDTFVSSDTPLEQPTFAFVPLGSGAVLRGVDDGLVSRRDERARVLGVAAARGIPLHVGTTHGSTDATPFVARGVPGMGLSWPGRYSHSPAEVLDLRDVQALARLIAALAVAP